MKNSNRHMSDAPFSPSGDEFEIFVQFIEETQVSMGPWKLHASTLEELIDRIQLIEKENGLECDHISHIPIEWILERKSI